TFGARRSGNLEASGADQEHEATPRRSPTRVDRGIPSRAHGCARSTTCHHRRIGFLEGRGGQVKVTDILASIDQGTMALPEFQRGYVWSRDQVRGLMQSLYKRYPVGSLLVWQTQADVTALKGAQPPFGNIVQLLLDGQQRVTTLYGIMRGEAPPFFQGNEKAFNDLYFDLRTET